MSVLGCNKSVVDCMCYKRGERGGGGRQRIFYYLPFLFLIYTDFPEQSLPP